MGIKDWTAAFDRCTNLTAGAKIFSECYGRSGNDYGKAISCYYSGNFSTGFAHGYVQKVTARMDKIAGKGKFVLPDTPVAVAREGAANVKSKRPLGSQPLKAASRGASINDDQSFIF